MVSVDERVSVEKAIRQSPKANALLCYLNGEEISWPDEQLNDGERIYYSLLDNLNKDKGETFRLLYDELSRRRVVEDQPIVYDNFILFILLVGAEKFKTDTNWLKSTVRLRKTHNEPEKSITTSFLNLLEKNVFTTDGFSSVMLAAMIKAEATNIDDRIVKNSFEANKKIITYLEKDLFLACILLITNDYIISVSIRPDVITLRQFESIFLRRIVLLQNIIYILILGISVAVWFFLINRYPGVRQVANDVGALLQLIGIGLLAYALNLIKDLFGSWFRKFFGYRK